ncbi:ABC transporter ATP-binding protein [Rurimicrobium arvi]|uniref:ATP-binding cassette domain-containing protein n=1 Tax=Rurimicrobium arvi TaxID=2049916 RepID=A0ABP8MIG2_9BACT
MQKNPANIIVKFLNLLKFEKAEIYSIYIYAILAGIIQLSLPLGIQSIISFVLGGAISTSIVILIIVVIVGVLAAGLLKVNQMKLIEKIQQQLFVRYSFQYAHNIPKLNLRDVDNYYLPELTNRFFDTITLQKGIAKLLLDVPAATIQILFGLILLSFYHPVFIFFGILLLLIVYITLRITGSRGLQTSVQESDYKYKVAAHLQEISRVVRTYKFSRDTELPVRKADKHVTGYLKSRTAHFRILLFQYWTLIAFKVVITAAMLIVGAFLLVNQQLNIGQFIAAEIVILMIIDSVEKLIVNLDNVYDVLTSVEKITKVTEKPLEQNGRLDITDQKGFTIKAQNLSFGYTDDNRILKNLNFTIKSGEKVCLQGAYSSGKSSLLKVISGSYKDFEGILSINDVSIHNYDVNTLRSRVGILLNIQEIFKGTLEENICLGDTSIPHKQLDKIAAVTGLKPYIDTLKDGYATELLPLGQHLSYRVIKKILLCRALIGHPALLLLEEPWMGLEDEYAASVQNYIMNELKDTTAIVVTSDNTFATTCDQLFFIDNGALTTIQNKDR